MVEDGLEDLVIKIYYENLFIRKIRSVAACKKIGRVDVWNDSKISKRRKI